jgi:hypothetical protein
MPLGQSRLGVSTYHFGTLPLQVMTKFGVRMTSEEREGFHMLWRYVCHLLGSGPEMCLPTGDEQRRLEQVILGLDHSRYAGYPPDRSRRLVQASITAATRLGFPYPRSRSLMEALVIEIHGEQVARRMGIDARRIAMRRAVLLALRTLSRALRQLDRWPRTRTAIERTSNRANHAIVNRGLAGVAPDYQMS